MVIHRGKIKLVHIEFHGATLKTPHEFRWTAWTKQFILFLVAWLFVKMTVVFLILEIPLFVLLAQWILKLVLHSGSVKLQVLVVMLLFPLIMNVVQAWLIDMLIKGKFKQQFKREEIVIEPSSAGIEEENPLLEQLTPKRCESVIDVEPEASKRHSPHLPTPLSFDEKQA